MPIQNWATIQEIEENNESKINIAIEDGDRKSFQKIEFRREITGKSIKSINVEKKDHSKTEKQFSLDDLCQE